MIAIISTCKNLRLLCALASSQSFQGAVRLHVCIHIGTEQDTTLKNGNPGLTYVGRMVTWSFRVKTRMVWVGRSCLHHCVSMPADQECSMSRPRRGFAHTSAGKVSELHGTVSLASVVSHRRVYYWLFSPRRVKPGYQPLAWFMTCSKPYNGANSHFQTCNTYATIALLLI
jgi:hypothetical protein